MSTGRVFALLGSPNAGKTTLFNALTGLRARVGNYPGVTVERREGRLDLASGRALLIDLPGTYGLTPISADEAVVEDVLAGRVAGVARPDALILVADACSLQRTLPFLGEALRLGRPTLRRPHDARRAGGPRRTPRSRRASRRRSGSRWSASSATAGAASIALRQTARRPGAWPRPAILPPADRREREAWADSIAAAVIEERPARHRLTERIDASCCTRSGARCSSCS